MIEDRFHDEFLLRSTAPIQTHAHRAATIAMLRRGSHEEFEPHREVHCTYVEKYRNAG